MWGLEACTAVYIERNAAGNMPANEWKRVAGGMRNADFCSAANARNKLEYIEQRLVSKPAGRPCIARFLDGRAVKCAHAAKRAGREKIVAVVMKDIESFFILSRKSNSRLHFFDCFISRCEIEFKMSISGHIGFWAERKAGNLMAAAGKSIRQPMHLHRYAVRPVGGKFFAEKSYLDNYAPAELCQNIRNDLNRTLP